jgi:hypothetical protein
MVATAGFAGYTRVGGEYKFRPGKKKATSEDVQF